MVGIQGRDFSLIVYVFHFRWLEMGRHFSPTQLNPITQGRVRVLRDQLMNLKGWSCSSGLLQSHHELWIWSLWQRKASAVLQVSIFVLLLSFLSRQLGRHVRAAGWHHLYPWHSDSSSDCLPSSAHDALTPTCQRCEKQSTGEPRRESHIDLLCFSLSLQN